MSLADLYSFGRGRKRDRWEGLRPPPASPSELWRDVRWQAALYREDALPLRMRATFLAFRVVQRLAYNAGWHVGGRE